MSAVGSEPSVVISAKNATLRHSLMEAWIHRRLLWWFTWRDVKVRFKQTALGVVWIVVQPLALMIVFTMALGRLAYVPSDGAPYPLFAYCGLVVWMFFAQTFTSTSASILSNSALISKVYFPRALVPLGAAVGRLLDVVISGSLLGLLVPIYDQPLGWAVVLAPCFLTIAWVTALGVGSLLAAASIRYRDAQQAIPFVIQVWLFASPVAYPASLVPKQWDTLYWLNPMVVAVEGFRACVLGSPLPGRGATAMSVVMAVAALGLGLGALHRTQHSMTDVL